MRKIKLTTNIAHRQADGSDVTYGQGCLNSVDVEISTGTVRYTSCVSNGAATALHNMDYIPYGDMNAADQATVKAFIDLALSHAQVQGKLPAGTLEDM